MTKGTSISDPKLFDAANELRGSVESAEYKHLVLGLVFLKYISESVAPTASTKDDADGLSADDEERRGSKAAAASFQVPESARWEKLLDRAGQPDLGKALDRALAEIESANPDLEGALPKIYASSSLPTAKLGRLMIMLSGADLASSTAEPGNDGQLDVFGRVYEYFVKAFARAEGHRSGEFYTPACVVELLVKMLEPYKGVIYDPACGSCGMFIQSSRFVRERGERDDKLEIFGQELNPSTWRLGRMNLAIHGLKGEVEVGDTLLEDSYPDLEADFVLANPPFNQKRWGAKEVAGDRRWTYGEPPDANANYAWIQHFVSHLSSSGRAGFVLANGSLTASSKSESEIRRALVEDGIVECIVALPERLFYTAGIPVCLWFLDRQRQGRQDDSVLFIDARRMGTKVSRTQIELSAADIDLITETYQQWRTADGTAFAGSPGFARAVTVSAIREAGFSLSPARYVGVNPEKAVKLVSDAELDDLLSELRADFETNARLSRNVKKALAAVGHEI